jgi:hypothetical protein
MTRQSGARAKSNGAQIKPRLWHSIRQPVSEWVRRRGTVEKLAAEYSYTVRILNDGQHWEFKRDGIMIEWWPSTGTTITNKRADLSCIHTLDGLRSALNKAKA